MSEEILSEAYKPAWIETFLGVLAAPRATFAAIREANRPGLSGFPGAVLVVALAFAADGLHATSPSALSWALVKIPCAIAGGVLFWLSLWALTGLVASCFGQPKYRLRAALVCLAWSFLPWLFGSALFCFHNVLGPGQVLLSVLPFAWMSVLQLIAINESFELKSWQTLALVFIVPTLVLLVQIMQLTTLISAAWSPFAT